MTRLHLHPLLQPRHCAWSALDSDSDVRRIRQGLHAVVLGDMDTQKARNKVTHTNTYANNIKAALDHYGHPCAITTEKQLYDIVQFFTDQTTGKIKTPRGITKRYDHMKKCCGWLEKIVRLQGHLPQIVDKWRTYDPVKLAMFQARDYDYKLVAQ